MNESRLLLSTVFITGAAVLIIEVAAVRVLTPFYGSSLYVFSSVLTVILLALSLGYRWGGLLADRRQNFGDIYLLTALAGTGILVLLAVSKFLLPNFATLLSPSIGALTFSLILFFTPALLLGMISPYIVKLLLTTEDLAQAGTLIGKVFFWGTLGSIAGSLASGFVLIPYLGVTTTISTTAVILLVVGLGGYLKGGGKVIVTSLLLVISLVTTSISLAAERAWEAKFVYADEGLYSSIVVIDTEYRGEPTRLLMRDTNHSSAIAINSKELLFDYTKFSEYFTFLKPDTTDYLVLGGGAYTVPRTLAYKYPYLQIDVVEFEPKLESIARTYFDFSTSANVATHNEDARVFLNRTDKQYDVIFADLFDTNHATPFHLATQEFFVVAKDSLKPDGLLIMNVVGTPKATAPSFIGSLSQTVESVFPTVTAYGLRPSHTEVQNVMFIARNGEAPTIITDTKNNPALLGVTLDGKLIDTWPYENVREIILTDDRAPIEQLSR